MSPAALVNMPIICIKNGSAEALRILKQEKNLYGAVWRCRSLEIRADQRQQNHNKARTTSDRYAGGSEPGSRHVHDADKKGAGIYWRRYSQCRSDHRGTGGYYSADRSFGKAIQCQTAYCNANLFKFRVERWRDPL